MSAKDIVKKNNKILTKYQKIACLRSRYYEFKERLKYKCLLNNVNFKLINESYTSKTCSNCGNYKNDLGKAKIYNCTHCNMIIDRDINGSRNIYIKSLI